MMALQIAKIVPTKQLNAVFPPTAHRSPSDVHTEDVSVATLNAITFSIVLMALTKQKRCVADHFTYQQHKRMYSPMWWITKR